MDEKPDNIVSVCEECADKRFLGKGKFTIEQVKALRYVKKCFIEGGGKEYMWVKVTKVEGNVITGILNNDPVLLKGTKCDDKVRLSIDEVEDIYLE